MADDIFPLLNACTRLPMVQYGTAYHMFHEALHGTPVHFCFGKLVFAHPNAVPHHGHPFPNNFTNKILFVHTMCVFLYIYSHLILTCTDPCSVPSHCFLYCHISDQKVAVMTYIATLVNNNIIYIFNVNQVTWSFVPKPSHLVIKIADWL